MKKAILSLALTAVFGLTATANPIDGEKKEVKTSESTVTWKAYKVTGSHTGTIDLKSGALEFDGDKLTGGEFVVDMTTINTTDLEGDYKQKLDGHLHSDDFFSTASMKETFSVSLTTSILKGRFIHIEKLNLLTFLLSIKTGLICHNLKLRIVIPSLSVSTSYSSIAG